MRKIFIVIALFLPALLSTGCVDTSARQSLLRLTPASSTAVLAVNWKVVGRDADLKRIVKGDEVERLLARLGIGPDAVKELVIFSDAVSSAGESSGVILQGSFESERVAAALKARGWSDEKHRGRKLYSNPADGACMVALGSDVLALGTRRGVEESVAARLKHSASFAGGETYAKLADRADLDNHPIAMLLAVPQDTQDMMAAAVQVASTVLDFASGGPLGDLLNKIGYVRGLGCTISREGALLAVEVTTIMKDEEAARFVSGALNLVQKVTELAPRNESSRGGGGGDSGRSQGVAVKRFGEVLSLRMVVEKEQLMRGS